ncbi:hypothetical protein [Comamonas sp. NLF-1-9]|uniref:hypothetical protein n=1 Tax=Comamonas sp. NLF-1-9 TaxID=2853163 RepID=UPI001C46C4ED|nr:hypothetical protein [Comamonas sp. NLF-1-9]QXL83452.1 hypothetical protein KUD94_09295 [Comamonas sp. NLF-1-9]
MPLSPVDRSAAQWTQLRPQSDLYSTGASGAVPVRPINPANAVESTDALGGGAIVRLSEKAGVPEPVQRDWTLAEVEKEKPKIEEPPPREPPLYQQLIDIVQSMWRASGQAVQIAEEMNQTTLTDRLNQQVPPPPREQPLTYADPSVKRSGGL